MKGVYFNDIHSYRDLNLILAPFTPTPAEPQLNFLKVSGRDGYLDLTEAHGAVKYNSREFLFTFTIAPGDDLTFDERVSKVSNAINGLKCKITLDRDPNYYWFGRCQVDKYAQDKKIGQVVIKATVDPFKLNQEETVLTVTQNSLFATYRIENGKKPCVPTIESSHPLTIVFGSHVCHVEAGINIVPAIQFAEGENLLTIATGTEEERTVKFTWREGVL